MQIPRLREWRERRALTQVELAERARVSARSVAGYEAGSGARLPTVRRLAEALDVEVTDLYGDPERPLGAAPPSPEQPRLNGFNGLEAEQRSPSLRAQIDLVNNLADYAEQEIEERDRELESKTSLSRKIKRNINANWALAMLHMSMELSRAFAEDPNMKDLVYNSTEVRELYRAHKRFDAAIEHTQAWFGNEDRTNVLDLDTYRRAQQARDRTMERRKGAGA